GGQRDTVGTTQLLNRPLTFSPSFWRCRSPVPSQMLRASSQALFRLLLLLPALDRHKRFALARCHFADFSSPGFLWLVLGRHRLLSPYCEARELQRPPSR